MQSDIFLKLVSFKFPEYVRSESMPDRLFKRFELVNKGDPLLNQ
jgi:hypothetical protein